MLAVYAARDDVAAQHGLDERARGELIPLTGPRPVVTPAAEGQAEGHRWPAVL